MATPQDELKKLLAGGNVFGGWDGVNGDPQHTQKQQEEAALRQYLEAKELADCFLSPAGQVALEHLEAKTVQGPSWPVDDMGLVNAVGYGIYREGQNSLVRYIHKCIRIAQEGPPAQEVDDGRGKQAGRKRGRRAPGTDGN